MRTYLLAALAILLAGPVTLFGQDVPKSEGVKTIEATGQGTDKDGAVRDALRKAVEQGAGTLIYSNSQTKDFTLVRDTVLARSAGFVQSHKVLSTKELEDGTWEAKISAVVSVKGIEDTWGVVTGLAKEMGHPKIMVFITEKLRNLDNNRDETVEDSTVQTRIENLLLESGFQLVDKKQIKEIDRKDLESGVAEDNAAKVQAIAKRFGAQLFITGSANATGQPRVTHGVQQYAYEAEANVKCYRSDTAQMLSAVPGAPTRGVQQVWRSAAKQALDFQAQEIAPKVRYDILRFWMDVLEGRGEIQLHVEEVSFAQYAKLKTALKLVKEIKDVNAEYHNKIAECRIQSELKAEALAEKIVTALPQLDISDVSANVIKAKFKAE